MACVSCKTEKCSCSASICTNPLIYLIDEVFSLIGTQATDLTIYSALNQIVDVPLTIPTTPYIHNLSTALMKVLKYGLSASSSKELCCADCNSNKTSYYGNYQLMSANTSIFPTACCLEYQSSPLLYNALITAVGSPVKCCDTDFVEIIQSWINSASPSTAPYSASFYLDKLINASTFGITTAVITNAGTLYTPAAATTLNVALTGGSGTGAKATVVTLGGIVTSITITAAGQGYTVGDTLGLPSATFTTTGVVAVFTVTVTTLITGAGGFFETSSYNGYSGMGILYNYLQLNKPTLNEIDYLNMLGILTKVGFKITCVDCRTNIQSIKVF
jgi:hypothetical protein